MVTSFLTWFSVRGGSVIPIALPIACVSGFINFALLYWNVVTDEDGGGLMHHPNVYMFFLSVVALVCAFHVNAAYQRYWEGRGALQRMDSSWSLAACALSSFRVHFMTLLSLRHKLSNNKGSSPTSSASSASNNNADEYLFTKNSKENDDGNRSTGAYDTADTSKIIDGSGVENAHSGPTGELNLGTDESTSLDKGQGLAGVHAGAEGIGSDRSVPMYDADSEHVLVTTTAASDNTSGRDYYYTRSGEVDTALVGSTHQVVQCGAASPAAVGDDDRDLSAPHSVFSRDVYKARYKGYADHAEFIRHHNHDENIIDGDFAEFKAECLHLISLLHSVATMYLLRTENHYGRKKAARRRGNPLEIVGGLSLTEKVELNQTADQSFLVYHWMSDYLYSYNASPLHSPRSDKMSAALPPAHIARLMGHLTEGLHAFDLACKIEDTPFPFAYVQVLFWLNLCIFIVAPLVVACWMTSIPLSVTITVMKVFTFTSIFLAAHQMESPFGYSSSNLPLLQLHTQFTERILTLLDYQTSAKLERMVAHSSVDCDNTFKAICTTTRPSYVSQVDVQNGVKVTSKIRKLPKIVARQDASLAKFVKGLEDVPLGKTD